MRLPYTAVITATSAKYTSTKTQVCAIEIRYTGHTFSKKNNTRDSNVVPHRSTNRARTCLTSLSRREAVL